MLENIIVNQIAEHVSLSTEKIKDVLEIPPNEELGDLAFPCFVLAKELKKSPHTIAEELALKLNNERIHAQAVGPYVNFFFHKGYYGKQLMEYISKDSFMNLNIGNGKRVIIDMSSPNIAKPFSIGHLRSTMIGNALYNIYKNVGYEPIRVNHIGDWGTQFGKLIVAFKKWGDLDVIKENPIKMLFELYVKFHEEVEKDPSLEDEARAAFVKLEQGDQEAYELWEYFVKVSMKEFERMYERLCVEFDYYLGESFYNDKMWPVVEELKAKQLLEESEGAFVVRLDEYDMPPCMILKSDGSTIYATRDLATAIYRHKELKGYKLLYVVGGEQTLHFKQVFTVLDKMGHSWSKDCQHVPFGLMKLEGKKMSTRKGRVITLEEVLNQAVERAKEMIEEKNPHLEDKEEVAEAMGIGAIIFGDLKHNRQNEVNFSVEEALNFEGETGPYVQYTYARIQSIKEKSGIEVETIDMNTIDDSFLDQTETWSLLKKIAQYRNVLAQAANQNEPSILARYLIKVCKGFNKFYQNNRIIVQDHVEMKSKLLVAETAGMLIKEGLSILGLKAPKKI